MQPRPSVAFAVLLAGFFAGRNGLAADTTASLMSSAAAPSPPATNARSAPSAGAVRSPPRVASSGSDGAVGWTLVGASAVFAVGAGIFGMMALQAQSDFQHTSLERAAADASDRYARDTAAFATAGAVAVLAAAVGVVLLTQSNGGTTASVGSVGFGGTGLAVVF